MEGLSLMTKTENSRIERMKLVADQIMQDLKPLKLWIDISQEIVDNANHVVFRFGDLFCHIDVLAHSYEQTLSDAQRSCMIEVNKMNEDNFVKWCRGSHYIKRQISPRCNHFYSLSKEEYISSEDLEEVLVTFERAKTIQEKYDIVIRGGDPDRVSRTKRIIHNCMPEFSSFKVE